MNIAEAMISVGDDHAPALWYGAQRLTYADLRARVHTVAGRLSDQGLVKGDRVGLLAENSPFFVESYLGVILAGLCVVPFQTDCSDPSLRQIVASTGMKRMLVSARFGRRVEPLAESLGIPVDVESHDPPDGVQRLAALPEIEPSRDLAAIMFTSGSTGEPKGVMVTHRNIECNARDIVQYLELTAEDRIMVVLPFYYCYGASLLHTHLLAGGSLVLNNRFLFPETVLEEMVQRECTGLAGVPSTYQILLRKSRFARRGFPALRWLQQAGGKLPVALIREIRQALPEVRFYVMYGQTEATARLSYLSPQRLDDKLGSVGNGLAHTRLEVLEPDGAPVRPGSDEVGEIVASGDNITLGYWADPEETARFFRGGKLHTGDLARVDADGFLFIVDRARDFIKSMGNRVSPREVEDVIAELPEVVESAVVGVADDIAGEAIKAFVVLTRPGRLTAEDVRRHCLKRLPNHKVPSWVEFLDRLPKNAHGKVIKSQLTAGEPSGSTDAP